MIGGHSGRARNATATPAPSTTNDRTAIAGTGGHGAPMPDMDMDVAMDVATGMEPVTGMGKGMADPPSAAPSIAAAAPAGRTVIMPCLRWLATSHQFIG